MENKKIEIVLEGVLKVIKDNKVIAIMHNDMHQRSQIFYACNEMGCDEIKGLLEEINDNINEK